MAGKWPTVQGRELGSYEDGGVIMRGCNLHAPGGSVSVDDPKQAQFSLQLRAFLA